MAKKSGSRKTAKTQRETLDAIQPSRIAKKSAKNKGTARKKLSKSSEFRRIEKEGKKHSIKYEESLSNLNKIDHIVVLMMENRSFDHMLGYRSLLGHAVDGIRPWMENRHNGISYRVHELLDTAFDSNEDPCHGGADVAEQRSNHNGGFVSNWVKTKEGKANPGLVMGYYGGGSVPTYDWLADEFVICDKWFSSVPGATWPNRLYAICGKCAGSKDNAIPPLYNIPSFIRHLDRCEVTWNWYSHDHTSLRGLDAKYRLDPGTNDDPRYRKFDANRKKHTFLSDAATGSLAAVSWIDPNFQSWMGNGNDDHPPADIMNGQELVLKTIHALQQSPNWSRSLLVIVYDEHGGLFDHVESPACADDDAAFRELGLRVPAFVVSPWVDKCIVDSTIYDHTTLIKTILSRFCMENGTVPDMGARVASANHLGHLLTRTSPRSPSHLGATIKAVAEQKSAKFQSQFLTSGIKQIEHTPNDLALSVRAVNGVIDAIRYAEKNP